MSRPSERSRSQEASDGYWPTAEQGHLLRAALLEGDAARAAWAEWKARVDLDRLDPGSQRLLPLLAHNLRRIGVRDAWLGRFEGFRRYVWVSNQLQMVRLAPVLGALHQARIRTMLLKGAVLARHYYGNMGLRPMNDVDVLVPAPDGRRAMEVLQRLGWRAAGPAPALSLSLDFRHSEPFVDAAGHQIDLHWHALREFCGLGADEELWAHAQPARPGDELTSMPAPVDLFLQVVVHGAMWNPVPPVRWVADAMTVLAATDQAFDWRRLVAQARRHALVLPLVRALAFLVDELDAPVPPHVLVDLRSRRVPLLERVEQRIRDESRWVGGLPMLICRHVRMTRGVGSVAVFTRLPRYLQHTYQLPTLWALPAALGTRALRRVRALSLRGQWTSDRRRRAPSCRR